jgi:hypothetical protein
MLFDAAVIIPTILRESLLRAVRSVYAQDIQGKVQVVVGIDRNEGDIAIIDELRSSCPAHMQLTIIDLGYSTARRHGGFYNNWSGGALRTIMSYAANSRYLAYLDDDNWWAATHLSDLLAAIGRHAWAYSYRWYVHPETQLPMWIDEWESVGPGKGLYADKHGGFADTNCLLLDKQKCHSVLPAWCIPNRKTGSGVDKVVFRRLVRAGIGACTGNATAYYVIRQRDLELIRKLKERPS